MIEYFRGDVWIALTAIGTLILAVMAIVDRRKRKRSSKKGPLSSCSEETFEVRKTIYPAPDQQSGSKCSIGTSIEDVRQKHSVILVDDIDNQKMLKNLPNGRYGFANAFLLPVSEFTPIERQKRASYSVSLELHKAMNGQIFMVGYCSKSDKARADDPSCKYLEMIFFCEPYQEFNKVVSLPIQSVLEAHTRSLGSVIVLDLKCRRV